MLEVARARPDIEWVLGDLAAVRWEGEFDLVVMTGHAFQVLTTDDQLRGALGAVRAALAEEGRFVFETRNPLVREWEACATLDAAPVRWVDAPGDALDRARGGRAVCGRRSAGVRRGRPPGC